MGNGTEGTDEAPTKDTRARDIALELFYIKWRAYWEGSMSESDWPGDTEAYKDCAEAAENIVKMERE